jgi:hypothetical protein
VTLFAAEGDEIGIPELLSEQVGHGGVEGGLA